MLRALSVKKLITFIKCERIKNRDKNMGQLFQNMRVEDCFWEPFRIYAIPLVSLQCLFYDGTASQSTSQSWLNDANLLHGGSKKDQRIAKSASSS